MAHHTGVVEEIDDIVTDGPRAYDDQQGGEETFVPEEIRVRTAKRNIQAIVTFTREGSGRFYDIRPDGSHIEKEREFLQSIPHFIFSGVIAEYGLHYRAADKNEYIVNVSPKEVKIRISGTGGSISKDFRGRVKSKICEKFGIDAGVIRESAASEKFGA